MEDKNKHSREQAKAQLDSIKEMVKALVNAGDDDTAREEAETTIQEDALSVEVRSDWRTLGQEAEKGGGQYRICLCTGGPACQIIGDLNEYNEPESARIEHQDWFTPWIDYPLSQDEEETVLKYVRCFYFGE